MIFEDFVEGQKFSIDALLNDEFEFVCAFGRVLVLKRDDERYVFEKQDKNYVFVYGEKK